MPQTPSGPDAKLPESPPNEDFSPGALLLLVLSSVGALLAWYVIERNDPRFEPSQAVQEKMGNTNAILTTEDLREIRVAAYSNAAFALAVWGLFVGVAMGTAEGIARRRFFMSLIGAITGTVLGAGFGVLGGVTGQSIYESALRGNGSIDGGLVLCLHAATFLVTSLGVGLGIALPRLDLQRVVSSALKAALAGLAGGMIYLIVASVALPIDNTDRPLPDGSINRLLWAGIPALLVGLVVGVVKPAAAHATPDLLSRGDGRADGE